MPNSRFALHGLASLSLIHGLCAFFASNSRFMRLFQAALDTPLDSPFSATLSVHGLNVHFAVCVPSINARLMMAQEQVALLPSGHGHFGRIFFGVNSSARML